MPGDVGIRARTAAIAHPLGAAGDEDRETPSVRARLISASISPGRGSRFADENGDRPVTQACQCRISSAGSRSICASFPAIMAGVHSIAHHHAPEKAPTAAMDGRGRWRAAAV